MDTWLGSLLPVNLGFAFTDLVSGRPVFYFTNRKGRYWMAEGRFSTFRCYLDHEPQLFKEQS